MKTFFLFSPQDALDDVIYNAGEDAFVVINKKQLCELCLRQGKCFGVRKIARRDNLQFTKA